MTGCYLWTGRLRTTGYGVFAVQHGDIRLAHRVMYETHCGPIPEGMVLDHICSQRCCVNPDHLQPVTPSDNSKRSARRGRYVNNGKHSSAKTHCPQGHGYTPENTGYSTRGSRFCRECGRIASRRWRAADNNRSVA